MATRARCARRAAWIPSQIDGPFCFSLQSSLPHKCGRHTQMDFPPPIGSAFGAGLHDTSPSSWQTQPTSVNDWQSRPSPLAAHLRSGEESTLLVGRRPLLAHRRPLLALTAGAAAPPHAMRGGSPSTLHTDHAWQMLADGALCSGGCIAIQSSFFRLNPISPSATQPRGFLQMGRALTEDSKRRLLPVNPLVHQGTGTAAICSVPLQACHKPKLHSPQCVRRQQ